MLTNMGQGHAWNNVVVVNVNLMVIKTHLHLFFPIFMHYDKAWRTLYLVITHKKDGLAI